MKYISNTFLILLFASLFIYSGCKDDSTSTPQSSCDQSCKDNNTAYGLVHVFNFIWNQHFAGQPTGNKDLTVNGPQGGSIHITGSTAYANGINTVHLIFDMTNCKGSDENYILTFTGVVNVDGTFSPSATAMAFISSALTFQGTVGKNANVPVNSTCEFTVNETASHLSGTICGRAFSYK
jgi:hypothetical protein